MNIFTDNKNFYPTPRGLIQRMCEGIDFSKINNILEPSAGKGNICDYLLHPIQFLKDDEILKVVEFKEDEITYELILSKYKSLWLRQKDSQVVKRVEHSGLEVMQYLAQNRVEVRSNECYYHNDNEIYLSIYLDLEDYKRYSEKRNNDDAKMMQKIDCIEYDSNLVAILKNKGYRVVANDFLTYHTYKQYDLIIMNPPFDNGEKHLLKALEFNTNIICLLNAETLKNAYSNERKSLVQKLNELGASIEYLENEFYDADAERKTAVEIALIKIQQQEDENIGIIIDNLKKDEIYKDEESLNSLNQLVSADLVEQIVENYNYEAKIGITLIKEFNKCKPFIQSSINDSQSTILNLSFSNENSGVTINGYIKKLRRKYWTALFSNDKFTKKMPSNMIREYHQKIDELVEYDFSAYNIKEIMLNVNCFLNKSVEMKIIDLFDELSSRHSWDDYSKNIHYFNGWKTNSAYKINKRVVIPLNAFGNYSWNKDEVDYSWTLQEKLKDIIKVLDFLDNGRTSDIDLAKVLEYSKSVNVSKNLEIKYFKATFYKKGTCHLEFKDAELLKKFNIFGAQNKGWLPPSYGKETYDNMSDEEKQVINEFEGEESYNETLSNSNFLLAKPQGQLLLN